MSKQITCRVRPTEEAAMRAAAEAKDLSLAEWMRQVLMGAAKRAGGSGSKKRARHRKT